MLSVCKIFRFEAAHAISNHPGKCKNIHGHSYALHVGVTSPSLNEMDMIMDFGELKKIVNDSVIVEFDHSLILSKIGLFAQEFSIYKGKILWLDKEPTAEYMLLIIKDKIMAALPSEIQLKYIELWETGNSFARWENVN